MAGAVVCIGALSYWDERREQAAALEDFAQEQATVAAGAASELATRLALVRHDALIFADDQAAGRPSGQRLWGNYLRARLRPPGAPAEPGGPAEGFALEVALAQGGAVDLVASPADLLAGMAQLAQPRAIALLVATPQGPLRSVDGRVVSSPELAEAFATGRTTVRLPPAAAASLGLSERTAMAGLSRVNSGQLGTWGVAVVASAGRERDREQRARFRLILAVALAAGLVVGFGGVALRQQRKELSLQRELAEAEVARERDQRLAQQSRAAAMVTFAGGVAHEISTPLGVIAGRAEQLQHRLTGDERAHKALQVVLEQTERIKQVIRGFLDLARGETPALKEAQPADVVFSAVTLVEHRFAKAGVKLSARVPDGLPSVHCDPRLLEHALVNLLLNACDACKGEGAVDLAVAPGSARLDFVVTDDGEGIPAAVAHRVAEPFFTTKPQGKGTGLGLAIAGEIAKIHRGQLRLEPSSPRGTRAVLEIPLLQGAPNV